jgi:large subunit ribosomal protein L35Ae
LYQTAVFSGFKRSRMNQDPNQSLIHIEGCKDKPAARFYLGKKVVLIRKAQTQHSNSRYRTIWGRVIGTHGSNGVVRAKFRHNLPAEAIGSRVRVLLY